LRGCQSTDKSVCATLAFASTSIQRQRPDQCGTDTLVCAADARAAAARKKKAARWAAFRL